MNIGAKVSGPPAAAGRNPRTSKPETMHGELVMGRFRLRERIGSGGMGVVYRGFDERLQREVAVKEIPAADPARVVREAQASARLNHPGIVTLYELGRSGSSALLVSELVTGRTLAELRADGRLTDRCVAEIGVDLCEALAHAHVNGVVHRDLKPQNVIAREDDIPGPTAKLMDFGIARLAGAPTLTATGEVVGTLAYMAPEQADGIPAGPEADVYALALTLYECWTGAHPVAGRTPAQTARRIGRPITSLGRRRPDLPADLVSAIDACLDPDPARRPGPEQLRSRLVAARPALDPDRPLPGFARLGDRAPGKRPATIARLAGALALVAVPAAIAGPAGAPGAGLVVAALIAPAALVLGTRVAALASAPLLAVAGAAGGYPAVAAHAGRRAGTRALAGALGWCWAMALYVALGLGPALAGAAPAASGWETSAARAASEVLAPLLAPASLAGAALFAAAAAILGWIMRARQLALAALGALVWAAALAAAAAAIDAQALGETPLIVAGAAAAAVGFEHARRRRPRRGPSLPPPSGGPLDPPLSASTPSHRGLGAVAPH